MMKKILLSSVLLIAGTLATSAQAAGDAEKGKASAASCAACHGADGNSAAATFPKLAGQNEEYIVAQLQAFKEGRRPNSMMAPMALGLSDEDMANIGAYYASQAVKTGVTADELAILGKNVYRGGVTLTKVPACIACHGAAGNGNGPAGFPALAGQHATYTEAQLLAFKKGERTTDSNGIMRNAVKLMSEKEIKAVAQYIQGLYQ